MCNWYAHKKNQKKFQFRNHLIIWILEAKTYLSKQTVGVATSSFATLYFKLLQAICDYSLPFLIVSTQCAVWLPKKWQRKKNYSSFDRDLSKVKEKTLLLFVINCLPCLIYCWLCQKGMMSIVICCFFLYCSSFFITKNRPYIMPCC